MSGELPRHVRERRRVALGGGALLWLAFMALPVLTAFTSLLDGEVDGIGVGYIVGAAEMVVALIAAGAYCRWADRIEAEAEEDEA